MKRIEVVYLKRNGVYVGGIKENSMIPPSEVSRYEGRKDYSFEYSTIVNVPDEDAHNYRILGYPVTEG